MIYLKLTSTRRAAVRIGGVHAVFLPDVNGQRLFLGPLHIFQQQGMMAQRPIMAAPNNMAMGAQAPQFNAPAQVAAPAIQAGGAAAGVDVASGRAVQNAGRNKVPRPPNAWIMYRQHHHASFVASHPELTNNQICKFPAY
jgi:CelD/BcsL family acetyltransferase involved in cellulose biosynthesis